MTIKRDINKLIPPRQRGKKRLAPLSGSRSIAMSRGIGKPGASAGTNFNEISRAYYTNRREIRSSDALFVLYYYNVATIVTDRATFNYLDYAP